MRSRLTLDCSAPYFATHHLLHAIRNGQETLLPPDIALEVSPAEKYCNPERGQTTWSNDISLNKFAVLRTAMKLYCLNTY